MPIGRTPSIIGIAERYDLVVPGGSRHLAGDYIHFNGRPRSFPGAAGVSSECWIRSRRFEETARRLPTRVKCQGLASVPGDAPVKHFNVVAMDFLV